MTWDISDFTGHWIGSVMKVSDWTIVNENKLSADMNQRVRTFSIICHIHCPKASEPSSCIPFSLERGILLHPWLHKKMMHPESQIHLKRVLDISTL